MSCRQVIDQLAAYADQALGAGERDRIAAHIVGCEACRLELADIIRVRSLLASCATPVAPQPDLTQRLVAIAGSEADQHLWLSSRHQSALPSPRRQRRMRVLFVLTGATAGLLGAVGSMALVAPGMTHIVDPDASSAELLPGPAAATASTLAMSTTDRHCPAGFECPTEILGMRRVGIAVDSGERVELAYSDGAGRRVAIVQQRGLLKGETDVALLTASTWQSGEVVYCVISSSPQLTQAVTDALPHVKAVDGSALERVEAGWHVLSGSRR